jgi:5-methylcytosine-specific restriction endonuclease McrBC regulatory subunit McrC
MRVQLKEFELSDPLPIEPARVPILQRRLGSTATLEYGLDGIRVRAGSFIGYIPIDDGVDLLVTPKVKSFSDLFYVLEKALLIPKQWINDSALSRVEGSERDTFPEFLLRLLLRKIRLIHRNGFLKRSLAKNEFRNSVKGKVAVTASVRGHLRGRAHLLSCTFFDPVVDNVENRFIKQTLQRLSKTPGLPKDIGRETRQLWRAFNQIPLGEPAADMNEIRQIIKRRRIPTNRSYYIDILSLCYLLAENSTVVVKEGDDVRICSFAIKMEDAFERYIRNVVVDELGPLLTAVDGKKSSYPLFSNSALPQITPDILVFDGLKCVWVADTKYKNKAEPNVEDWYQIISYAMAFGLRRGVLIYSTEQPKPPRKVEIDGKSMWVYFFALTNLINEEDRLLTFIRDQLRPKDLG